MTNTIKNINLLTITKYRTVLIVAVSLLFAFKGKAQRVIQPKLIEFDTKGIVYKYEKAGFFRLIENGFSLGYHSGEILTYYKTKYYNIEIGQLRDPREQAQARTVSLSGASRKFIYGKINNVINIRASIGRKRYLSEKAKRRGLAVGYAYEIGPSIALLKPYYLELYYNDGTAVDIRSEKFSEENKDVFLDINRVAGSPGYGKGFDEIKVVPGVQAKVAAHFAIGAFDKSMKTFEVGLLTDIYTKPLEILYETEQYKNSAIFMRFFIAAHLGLRKIK